MATQALQVVFLDRDTISPETIIRPFSFDHELTVYDRTSIEQVAGRIANADIVITNKVPLRREALAGATRLKMIAVAATGTDNIDLATCAEKNVVVSNIRGYAVNTVPEHTFALIFALRRSIVAYRESVKEGRWQQSQQFCYFDYPIKDLAGSTLGIIGEGVLGQSVATIGRALGMRVLFAARKGGQKQGSLYTPFEQFLEQSDVITLHCPLNEQTRDLIGDAEFALMKRKPLLINTARGGLVNDDALVRAMRSGQLGGAGFDVTTPEPAPDDHPLVQLLDLPNFILTPHVAWASQEAIQGLADQLIDNIDAFHQGQPRNVVGARK
ncbi:D-2-hydroxyacid dehydrogenase [Pollutimonas harenae]|uniref:D-2-hydroxyacid dehydrogenase n=1 Tax=Pollutimonas harenae TaxID=657015 RepID=A0A853H1T0_9BURK|nr:D-2-hydroxyacid dehydrogenase [Pollutimonas harenae]NYT85980.1 D-2-hydroxyacid dehydrogenase [Pollutimonas harenae]TEA71029.1 D-2-hydroxyacid dehydrogenase [Pollutimonas harenae]